MLEQNDVVTIQCPSEKKYPAFHKAYHGRRARVVSPCKAVVSDDFLPSNATATPLSKYMHIDVSAKGEAPIVINVERRWLARISA